uniref:Uncharacterized protein n=1 Tax=Anguilla anguilla TaxID=7936 RepID=A0A0E9PX79_ANGAN
MVSSSFKVQSICFATSHTQSLRGRGMTKVEKTQMVRKRTQDLSVHSPFTVQKFITTVV